MAQSWAKTLIQSRFRHVEWPPEFCKFLLNIGQVRSAATRTCLRLLLPKEFWPVIKSKGSLTFVHQHCEYLLDVFKKDMTDYNCLWLCEAQE